MMLIVNIIKERGVRNTMSIHSGPRLNLMHDRLAQGKCCACGEINPCKKFQILCPDCMKKSKENNLHDNFYNHRQETKKRVKNKKNK